MRGSCHGSLCVNRLGKQNSFLFSSATFIHNSFWSLISLHKVAPMEHLLGSCKSRSPGQIYEVMQQIHCAVLYYLHCHSFVKLKPHNFVVFYLQSWIQFLGFPVFYWHISTHTHLWQSHPFLQCSLILVGIRST